jgi:ferritin-like metal-binding protein YciE
MKTLKDLFLASLADVYYAEYQLVRGLSKMAKAAKNEQLREAFELHLEQTEGHVKKVESVFTEFGVKARKEECDAIIGLLEESERMASENKGSPTLDAALIAAAQKVEHYEIATYGSLQEWAGVLGQDDAADILEEILEEEKEADTALSELARSCCNAEANEPSEKAEDQEVNAGVHRGRSLVSRTRGHPHRA